MTLLEKYKIDPETGIRLDGDPSYGDTVRYVYYTESTGKTTIVDKIWAPVPPPPVVRIKVFIHVDITGGDGEVPPGINKNNVDFVSITFTLRETENPASAVKTAISRNWQVKLRDQDGNLYDYLQVAFVNGVATIQYTATRPGVVSIFKEDVSDIISGAEVTLVPSASTSPMLKVYNDLTGA